MISEPAILRVLCPSNFLFLLLALGHAAVSQVLDLTPKLWQNVAGGVDPAFVSSAGS